MRAWMIVALTGCSVHRPSAGHGGSEDSAMAETVGTDDAADTGPPETPSPPDLPTPSSVEAEIAPMHVVEYGVFVEVSFDGGPPALLRYDTGSPTTYVDGDWAAQVGLPGGAHDATIGEVAIGSRPVSLIDWIEADVVYPGLPSPVLGLVGNDFFAGSTVGLHHAHSELWLYRDVAPDAALELPPGVDESSSRVEFEDREGYLVVDCRFDASVAEAPCLFDTGAVFSVAYEHEWAAVEPLSADRVPFTTFDNRGTTLQGYYQRSTQTVAGSIALAADVVSVLPTFELLDRVGEHLDVSLRGLVGLQGTFGSFTIVDYVQSEVRLHPYDSQDPLWPSPFIGFGFTVASTQNGSLVVSGVVPASLADGAGVMAGDRLADASPGGLGALDFTIVGLVSGAPGQTRSFTFERDGEVRTVELAAADHLPLP